MEYQSLEMRGAFSKGLLSAKCDRRSQIYAKRSRKRGTNKSYVYTVCNTGRFRGRHAHHKQSGKEAPNYRSIPWREHINLYIWAQRSVRLPVPNLRLKDLAEYFGVPHNSDIKDGMEAQMLYRRTGDEATRQRLLDYNRDDLDATIGVEQGLKRLGLSS